MKEKPILFSAPMVRAILDGRKTQTRRVVKPQPLEYRPATDTGRQYALKPVHDLGSGVRCPYHKGQNLWLRETWGVNGCFHDQRIFYKADNPDPENLSYTFEYHPSIHMPRWASRITLEVINVRVERVQDISDEDARAEGVEPSFIMDAADFIAGRPINPTYRNGFMELWGSLNAKRGFGWDVNPWVWVIEFKVVKSDRSNN